MPKEDTSNPSMPPRPGQAAWTRPAQPWGFDVTAVGATIWYDAVPIVGPTRDWIRIVEALRPVTPETLCLMRDLGRVWQIMEHLDRMRMRVTP